MDKQYKAVLQQLRSTRAALAAAGQRVRPALLKEEARLAQELARLTGPNRAASFRVDACGKKLLSLLSAGRPTPLPTLRKLMQAAGFTAQELDCAVSDLDRDRQLIQMWGRGLLRVS